MDKLVREYNKECNYTSKLVNRLWKIGQLVILIIFEIKYLKYKNFLENFIIASLSIIILYFICKWIESILISKKLKMKYKIKEIVLKRKCRREIYKKFDKFQKDWITKYCKKNKINNIEKLKIVKEELQEKQNNKIVKYIDPIIIGSLLITIWDTIVKKISEEAGTINGVIICFFLTIIFSMLIGKIKKEWQEQKEFMNIFNRYSGDERLKELIIYRILKSNK